MMRAAVLAMSVVAVSGKAVELNKDNFDAMVKNSGKNAFVKFLAPWYTAIAPLPLPARAPTACPLTRGPAAPRPPSR